MTTDELIQRLKEQATALGDGRDTKSDNERSAWWAVYTTTTSTISGLLNAPEDLLRAEAKLADVLSRREDVIAKQAELERDLADAPTLDHPDGRERDRRFEHVRHLKLALEHLHDGTLRKSPDAVYEPIDVLDARIKELTERRDRAQATLDAHLKTAEQLLGVTT